MHDQSKPEESEILEKFERGELRRTAEAESEIEAARIAARNTFRKALHSRRSVGPRTRRDEGR